MKRKIVVAVLSTSLCCTFVNPVVAQVQILALPVIANPVGLVLVGTVVIGGVIWYEYENRHTHKRYRSQIAPTDTIHTESNEEHEEKLVNTTTKGKSCEEIAEDLSKETGKKWRVKKKRIIPFTGPLWQPPGNPVQFECLLTTKPEK